MTGVVLESQPTASRHGAVRPQASIIVPVYNDPTGIETTLVALCEQTYPRADHEIVVADNGSTDETRTVVRRFADEYENVSLVVEDDVQGSYAARNAGIRATEGPILGFLDADMTVGPDWLARTLDRVVERKVAYLTCDVEQYVPDEEGSVVARYDRHTGFPIGRYVSRQEYAPTCCLFVRRSVIEDIGAFDPRFTSGGDAEFGNRVAAAGYSLEYAPEITASHPTRTSLRSLLRKELRVGRGICQQQRYYPDRYGPPGRPPMPSGVKSPNEGDGERAPLAFSALSAIATATRGLGYAAEFTDHLRSRR